MMNTKRYSYMEENVNQTEKEMAENEKQNQTGKEVAENEKQNQTGKGVAENADREQTETIREQTETIRGLTAQQVAERKEKGLWNKKAESATKTTKEIVKSNVFTYFNLIFLVIALLLIGVGAFRDLTFLPIIVANTLIGIVQEIRSKKVLDDLSILNSPKTRVIREGSKKEIPAEELVMDDIVELSAGGQIPADAVVLEGQLNVNESLLTGESDEIVKKSGDELLSGSFVVSGSCLARLTKVGEESYISKLTHDPFFKPSGTGSWYCNHSDRCGSFCAAVCVCRYSFAGQCNKHGGCDPWYDTGGTLSVSKRCYGGKCHASGKTAGFNPRHEMY